MLIRIRTFTTVITNVIFEHHNYLHHSRVYQWFWIFLKIIYQKLLHVQ